jgi:two-component system LytT family response regulator
MLPRPLKVLIVDDEPPARNLIDGILRTEEGVEVAGQCANGREALEAINRLAPDLVFLDVQMPGLDGFGVARALPPARRPALVFVTAYDRHAVQAFEIEAVDYLLKPFEYDRVREAVKRVRARLAAANPGPAVDRIALRDGRRVLLLPPDEIECVEAEQNYVRLHAGPKSHLIHETLKGIEQRLPPRKFVRVSRSALVNLERVRELQGMSHGDALVVLHGGRQIVATRSYRDRLDSLIARLA